MQDKNVKSGGFYVLLFVKNIDFVKFLYIYTKIFNRIINIYGQIGIVASK